MDEWAIKKGYAPSAESHRAHPEKYYNEDGTPKTAAEAMAAGGDKAEAIPGDFYKEGGRSWAEWVADQAFGSFRRDQDEAAAAGGAYPATAGFPGRNDAGPFTYIQEKLAGQRTKVVTQGQGQGQQAQAQEAALEANGEIQAVAAADKMATVADPYKYETFVGRSAVRAANGLATGAAHVAAVVERPLEMAESGLKDVQAAYATADTDKQAAGAAAPATPAVSAMPAAPATDAKAAPEPSKHKNMRGGSAKK